MFELKKRIYEAIPSGLRNLIRHVPYAWLAGRPYREALVLCASTERVNVPALRQLQESLLRTILEFATREVPFYMPYREAVISLPPLEALRAFPVISKQTVQENLERLVPRCLSAIRYHKATTGGSTGSQLTFNEDDGTYGREMGFMHAQWARVGYTPSRRKATFRGVPFRSLKASEYWQENPIHNELQFSPFHMSEENLPSYLQCLESYRPEYLHGYPSAISVLAEHILRKNRIGILRGIKAVLLCSEHCPEEVRTRIEAAFGTRVYTWYGHSERVILAGECEHSSEYHSFPGYGHTELLRPDRAPCDVGEAGELVGTGFYNRSMPLIRYATDDYATRSGDRCTACGRNWFCFRDVQGRWNAEGTLVSRSGAPVSAAAINMHGDMFDRVVRYQYRQDVSGEVRILVLPAPGYGEADTQAILTAHRQKLADDMGFRVELVDDIPLTSSGKQRRIVSALASS